MAPVWVVQVLAVLVLKGLVLELLEWVGQVLAVLVLVALMLEVLVWVVQVLEVLVWVEQAMVVLVWVEQVWVERVWVERVWVERVWMEKEQVQEWVDQAFLGDIHMTLRENFEWGNKWRQVCCGFVPSSTGHSTLGSQGHWQL